jgi:hypothetical protein
MSSARTRAAPMAERSVLTVSSKARISSCSLSLNDISFRSQHPGRSSARVDEEMATALDEAAAELRQALAKVREPARGIHLVILSEAGWPALGSLADLSPIPIPVNVTAAARPAQRVPLRYCLVSWSHRDGQHVRG